jgi:hypothetical protein
MHYAILNSSGNALEWFTDEAEARRALDEMLAQAPGVEVDLVAFEGPGRPVEPVSLSVRSAWPAARLVWSSQTAGKARNAGNVVAAMVKLSDQRLGEREDGTDDRVGREAYSPSV